MDDLLSEFLTETNESMESLDVEVVRLEQDPNDPELLGSIFRLVHTIKGTCGFLGLPRLESVAHSAENVLGKFRDGELPVTPEAVTLIFESLDQIKSVLTVLADTEAEPDGDDSDLIARLNAMAEGGSASVAAPPAEASEEDEAPSAAAAPAAAKSSKPLFEQIGGIAAIDAAAEVMLRKINKDEELAPFVDGADMTIGFFRTDGPVFSNSQFQFATPTFGTFAVDSVPEPGTSLLMGMGVLGLIMAGRASRKS